MKSVFNPIITKYFRFLRFIYWIYPQTGRQPYSKVWRYGKSFIKFRLDFEIICVIYWSYFFNVFWCFKLSVRGFLFEILSPSIPLHFVLISSESLLPAKKDRFQCSARLRRLSEAMSSILVSYIDGFDNTTSILGQTTSYSEPQYSNVQQFSILYSKTFRDDQHGKDKKQE